MSRFWYLLIVAIGLSVSSCSIFGNVPSLSKSEKDTPLPKFIMGEWEGSEQVTEANRDSHVDYRINFKNESSFEFIRSSPDTSDYDYSDEYTYQFVSENSIQVQSLRVSKPSTWKIERSNEKLNVCFLENDCVLFARKDPSFLWWLIIISTVAILGLLIYLGAKRMRSASHHRIAATLAMATQYGLECRYDR